MKWRRLNTTTKEDMLIIGSRQTYAGMNNRPGIHVYIRDKFYLFVPLLCSAIYFVIVFLICLVYFKVFVIKVNYLKMNLICFDKSVVSEVHNRVTESELVHTSRHCNQNWLKTTAPPPKENERR